MGVACERGCALALGLLLAGMLLASSPCALALNPSLDVSQYAHTAWKVREGFLKGQIFSIAQTPDGYLWLGTEFGLYRFDGIRAVPWQPPADQPLPSGQIFSLLVARDGALWIGTSKGLASWKDGNLTQYTKLAGQYIYKLLEDHERTIWVGAGATPSGRLCAIQNGSIQCYGENGALGRLVFGLYEDSKGDLWVGVKNGLWRWKPGTPRFYPVPDQPDGIQGFGEGDDGALLIGTVKGIRRFVDGKLEAYRLPGVRHFDARRILRDRDGGLWIGTDHQGLVHVHKGGTDAFFVSDGLSGERVLSLLEDREGNIWVATINGLDRFRDFAVEALTVKQGLPDSGVQSVLAARDGSVWLGTPGGLKRWNEGQITSYGGRSAQPQRRANTGGDKREGKVDALVPDSLFQDSSGRIWVSTLQGVGYLENDRFIPVRGIPGGNMLAITQDAAGNLWVANEHLGLFQLDRGGKVQQIPWTRLGHRDHVSTVIVDPLQGGLWLGFHYGGVVYFEGGQVRASTAAAEGLGEGRVNDLRFDRDGTLWAATDGGLSRLKNGRAATLTSKSGLPCNAAHWVTEDDDRSLWLDTACGLVRISRLELNAWINAVDEDKDTKQKIQATVFESSDGVRSHADADHYSPQVAKTSDGRIWFVRVDGVSVVDPRHLPFNEPPPPVHIEQIAVDGKTCWQNSSGDASSSPPKLPSLARDLTIDYTALSLVVPEKVRFRFKLEGQDRDWREVVNNREVQYSNLPPKKYRFRVTACNNSGVWNEAGTFLDFSVVPAYYQTFWFRSLGVAAFLASLGAVYRLRLRQLARQFNMRLEERVSERTRIARELHDTLLQSLHGLMFRFQAARNMLPRSPEEAMEALDGAIMRTEQAIDQSQDAIRNLRYERPTATNLEEMLTETGRELETAGGANGNPPIFRVLAEGERQSLSPALLDEVYRISCELLQNAFRHARAHHVEAEIRYTNDLLRVCIRDDGKGIDPSVLKEGRRAGHWGLPGVRERAQQLGAKLHFWSEAGAGTEVQLTVPGAIAYKVSGDRTALGWFRKTRAS